MEHYWARVSGTVLLAITAPIAAQPESTDWNCYLVDQAPRAWAKFDERAARLQGSWTEVWRQPSSTDPSFKMSGEFKQHAGCGLLLMDLGTERFAAHGANK